jgi:hypothetical protein
MTEIIVPQPDPTLLTTRSSRARLPMRVFAPTIENQRAARDHALVIGISGSN